MRHRLAIATALVCLSLAAPGGSASAPASTPPPGPVIVRIVQRHQVIVARAGPHGPTYALESRTGQPLSPDLTLSQLAVRNPALHDQVQTLNTAVAWAGIQD